MRGHAGLVRAQEPQFRHAVEFGAGFHADDGAEAGVDQAHQAPADARMAERPVHLSVVGQRDHRGLVEFRVIPFGLPFAHSCGAHVVAAG